MPELLLVAVGVALRLRLYLADRALWMDEAMLANALTSLAPRDLLLAQLPENQAAPPAVLLLMRACVALLGADEAALRLVALVAGVAGVVAAWRVAPILFGGRAARHGLIGLVALSPTLIYYSAEAKQYGVDATVCLILLGVGLAGDGRASWRLAAAGALAPWFSHAAVFLLPGIGLVQALRAMRRAGGRALVSLLGVAAVWTASGGAFLLLTRATVSSNPAFVQMWHAAFAPFPLRSTADLAWYGRTYVGLVTMALKAAGAEGSAPGLWWPAWMDAALGALVTGGLVGLAGRRRGRAVLAIVLVTSLVAVAASAARQYPLAHRLLVFAVPLLFVVLAGAVDALAATGRAGAVAACGLAAALIALTVPPAISLARHPPVRSDVKGALAYVAAHAQAGDRLAPTGWSAPAVRFYRPDYDLGRLDDAPGTLTAANVTSWVDGLRARDMLGRTWIVITHRFPEREQILAPARKLGRQLDAWEGNGAGAYLLDFGEAAGEERGADAPLASAGGTGRPPSLSARPRIRPHAAAQPPRAPFAGAAGSPTVIRSFSCS